MINVITPVRFLLWHAVKNVHSHCSMLHSQCRQNRKNVLFQLVFINILFQHGYQHYCSPDKRCFCCGISVNTQFSSRLSSRFDIDLFTFLKFVLPSVRYHTDCTHLLLVAAVGGRVNGFSQLSRACITIRTIWHERSVTVSLYLSVFHKSREI